MRRDKGRCGFERVPWYIGERGHGRRVVNNLPPSTTRTTSTTPIIPMPPYPTRSYVRSHPTFELDDGSGIATQSPSKRSSSGRSPYKRSPSKQSPNKRSQRGVIASKRPQIKVSTFATLREGSVQPTPRTTDPTTPQTLNPPTSEDLGRAPRKLKRASRIIGGGMERTESWLAERKGVRDDISPLTSLAPGRLPSLAEVEVEDEAIMQREYVKLMDSREATKRAWGREKENQEVGGVGSEVMKDVDQGASSAVSSGHPAPVHGLKRADTEEVFN